MHYIQPVNLTQFYRWYKETRQGQNIVKLAGVILGNLIFKLFGTFISILYWSPAEGSMK